ncbi:MAG: gas vesicle protein GvpG [Streptosporangiaceae bacterium]|nr:gas vesicle protein GvpG [Streptosporangiaceae bacterium]
MGLLTLPFRLPLLPVTGVIRLAEIIRDQAEQELHDPARVRRQLEEIEEAEASGELSAEEAAQAKEEVVRLLHP